MNAADCEGETPLHYASEAGHLEVIHLLLRAGAKVDVRRRSGGEKPVDLARDQECWKALQNGSLA